MEEVWKDICGYEGYYQVSNLGRVRSVDRKDRTGRSLQSIIRSQSYDKYGYAILGLYKNGKMKTKKVHRLVAKAFVDNPNGFPEVNHKDENKKNNNANNLEWCTTKYNLTYGHRLDAVRGTNSNTVKLTEDQVREIRKIYIKNDPVYGQSALGKRYGVSHTNIGDIVKNKSWKHLI